MTPSTPELTVTPALDGFTVAFTSRTADGAYAYFEPVETFATAEQAWAACRIAKAVPAALNRFLGEQAR